MNKKIKTLITNARVIILLTLLVLAVVAINPNPWNKGVAIRNIAANSSADLAGMKGPLPTARPMSREVINFLNNKPVASMADYHAIADNLKINQTVSIKTNKGFYRLTVREKTETIILNETETKTIEEIVHVNETINGTVQSINKTITKTIVVNKTETKSLGPEDIGISVYEAPKTNINKGLDLEGGVRILLQPEEKLAANDMGLLLDSMNERLNVYGLSDLIIKEASDLSGNQYILVEIPGGNEKDVKLLKEQGKFEAKIGNKTVFIGGKDITYVCRSADCAGIDPNYGCNPFNDQWLCRFRFSIALSQEAAQRQADLTKELEIISSEDNEQYLTEKLVLFLDNKQVDELNIGADLKGRAVTDIQISGSGVGGSQQQAALNSLENMKRLQTILKTGSLPVKLNIVKTDSISPVLGGEFIKNSLLMSLLAILSVAVVIAIRYKKLLITIPIMITLFSEVVILLGVAALIHWNLDIASIAGIIIMLGTGVNDQIVITDEILMGKTTTTIFNWKERIKRAFSIVFGAYATVVVAMIPLLYAGAGLLKGKVSLQLQLLRM